MKSESAYDGCGFWQDPSHTALRAHTMKHIYDSAACHLTDSSTVYTNTVYNIGLMTVHLTKVHPSVIQRGAKIS